MVVIGESDYRKICSTWVPKVIIVEHNTAKKKSVQNFSSTVRKTEMLLCQE